MGYVAVQGGVEAIENAERLNRRLRLGGESPLLSVAQIQDQLGLLVDRVMSEGGLYSPLRGALALKQTRGEPVGASFYLRAYRSTLRRITDSLPISTADMRIERRISSAFKTIPGGQILGSTSDYEQRVLDFSLLEESEDERSAFVSRFQTGVTESGRELPSTFRKVVDILREQGLVARPLRRGRARPRTSRRNP